jgi:predicted nucleotidyltransferase
VRRDEVLARLAAHWPELTERGVARLAVFGSVGRDEARADSDVDLLVEFDRPVGLFTFSRLWPLARQKKRGQGTLGSHPTAKKG